MQELLPENWPDLFSDYQATFHSLFGKKKAPPVTNILTWVECFGSMVSVLSQIYPSFVPELMAYMSLIVKCQKRFEGLGWFTYDRTFRRQAVIMKAMSWSRTDSTLFSLAFTGKAKKSSSCDLWFSSNHSSSQCQESQTAVTFSPAWPTHATVSTQSSHSIGSVAFTIADKGQQLVRMERGASLVTSVNFVKVTTHKPSAPMHISSRNRCMKRPCLM
jgi:hypothetical protein